MSATITLPGDFRISSGSIVQTTGTGNLGVYATGGIAVSAAKIGLGRIDSFIIHNAGGYSFEYVPSTGKVKAYYQDGGVVAHTHDILIIGGQAAASTAATAWYATDILGKEAATDKTIAGVDSATKGGISGTTSTQGGATEVTDTTDITAAVFNWRATGV